MTSAGAPRGPPPFRIDSTMSRSIPPHRGDPRPGRRSYHDAGAGYTVSMFGLSKVPRWSLLALLAILVFDVWLRGHTFGPTVRDRLGWAPWPVVVGEAEPLDCDEAVYAYMGRRMLRGDALYRDLSEPKPPGGDRVYNLAIALGRGPRAKEPRVPLPTGPPAHL